MPSQVASARLAALTGSLALILGMVYGTQVPGCPHPQLALGAHVQYMGAGTMGLLAGFALNAKSLCHLDDSPITLTIIDLAHWTLVIPATADAVGAYVGLGMPLVVRLPDPVNK